MAGAKKTRCDGDRLRELRDDLEIPIRELAAASGVDATSIVDLEHGRRSWVYPKTLKGLAAALSKLGKADIDWKELLLAEALDEAAAPPTAPKRRIADELPARSSLDEFVAAERQENAPPGDAPVPPFGPTALVETFTAYAARAGQRFGLAGEVTHQRGLRITDCQVLGIDHAIGARFEIARRFTAVKRPFLVTVITMNARDTLRLQQCAATGTQVTLAVRLIATRPVAEEDATVRLIGLDESGELRRPRRFRDESWQGFEPLDGKIGEQRPKPHPWALIVEAIIEPHAEISAHCPQGQAETTHAKTNSDTRVGVKPERARRKPARPTVNTPANRRRK